MSWLNNVKVGQKLALLVFVLLVFILGVGGTGYYFLGKTDEALETMYSEQLMAIALLNDSRMQTRKVEANIYALMLTTNSRDKAALLEDTAQRAKQYDENWSRLKTIVVDDDDKAVMKLVEADLIQYRLVRNRAMELAAQHKNAEAYVLFSQEGSMLADRFNEELGELAEGLQKDAAKLHRQNEMDYNFASKLITIAIASSIIAGVLLGWMITRQITTRLREIVTFLGLLAEGDFSEQVSEESLNDKSEFGTVACAADHLTKNIRDLVCQLANTSEQLAASAEELTASAEQSAQASNQVAGSVSEVAQGAEKQLFLVNNTNGIVSQITGTINQVGKNAETVSDSSERTTTAANAGEQAIQQAVSQMKMIEAKVGATAVVITELEGKSNQIGKIVDVISSISGQTNLLALNAAIEAARAGEAGRGFAVVAEEVRKLAEQSQEAAKQITGLITDVQSKIESAVAIMGEGKQEVDSGTNIVSDAGRRFGEILHMIRDMTKQTHEISDAMHQVTNGMQGIAAAVQDNELESKKMSEQTQTISAATEEQSASVEEIASASQHLAKMAEELQKAIRKFKI